MRKAILASLAFVIVLGLFETNAFAMGGMGGPSDAWGSPYALYAPQSLQPPPGWRASEGRSAYQGQTAPRPMDCHGNRACERRMKRAAPAAQ